jgi:hypothetical protein
MTNTTGKAPRHLWIVGVIAVLFNAIGAFDYVMSMSQGADYMASAGMTPEQVAFMHNYPMWMKVVWPTGVWTAFVGSLFILARKKVAFPLFVVSLAAFLLSLLYSYVLTNGGETMGAAMMGVNAVITAELVFLIWYTRAMTQRGVLR